MIFIELCRNYLNILYLANINNKLCMQYDILLLTITNAKSPKASLRIIIHSHYIKCCISN